MSDVSEALEHHVRRFFRGRTVDAFTWAAGPISEQSPDFRVLRVAPAARGDLWTYLSIGGWAATSGLEFVLCTESAAARAVELLAMTVYYQSSRTLGLGHTLPIGEPWLPGSTCDHLLISLPYPFGPDLQTCHVGDRHVDFLWLLPITESERAFKVASGLEALESRFDQAELRYWQPDRPSVI
ncbi:suppressor of fused domain protein [Kribbella sp. NPDC005582]|uniref:suppressor of fused domain protein n=1 Tax=Kribbella sp. NPDC005582 TaxID=3156893 RepID=UPI0033B1C62E